MVVSISVGVLFKQTGIANFDTGPAKAFMQFVTTKKLLLCNIYFVFRFIVVMLALLLSLLRLF